MSLLVAAGIGLGLGAVGSNFVFNYTKNVYTQKISELQRLIDALQEHLVGMRDLRSQVPGFWDDESARKVCQELDNTILETERQMDTTKIYLRSLQSVVDEMGGAQGVMSQTLDDLRNMINMGTKG